MGQTASHYDAVARTPGASDRVPWVGFGLLHLFLCHHRSPPTHLPTRPCPAVALSRYSSNLCGKSKTTHYIQ